MAPGAHRLPVYAIATSLVANWVASENLTGTTGQVACSHVIPAILLDPIGAALCLALLGVLLAPYAGRYETMTDIVIDRYGVFVGGLASLLCLVGSLLWAGGQYKAVLGLLKGIPFVPDTMLEPVVLAGLLSWTLLGGLVADVWLDLFSIVIIAPCVLAIAGVAFVGTPAQVVAAEVEHARQSLPSRRAADLLVVGVIGNMFTEELAGRVLLAESPRRARAACYMSAVIFGIMGLAPAALGVWAKSVVPSMLVDEEGVDLCKESQDELLSIALRRLLPAWMLGAQVLLSGLLVVESLNTVDTSILMCAKVFETQIARASPSLQDRKWLPKATVVVSMLLVAGISRCGDNVWELGEAATSACGAPLGVLCLFLPFGFGGSAAALGGAVVAQGVYAWLKWGGSTERSDALESMPFVWSLCIGTAIYALVAMCSPSRALGVKEE